MGTTCCLGQSVLPNPRSCVLNRGAPLRMSFTRFYSQVSPSQNAPMSKRPHFCQNIPSSESKRPHNIMMHIVLIIINKCILNGLDVESRN